MKHTFVIVMRRFPGAIVVLRDCISDKNISVWKKELRDYRSVKSIWNWV